MTAGGYQSNRGIYYSNFTRSLLEMNCSCEVELMSILLVGIENLGGKLITEVFEILCLSRNFDFFQN